MKAITANFDRSRLIIGNAQEADIAPDASVGADLAAGEFMSAVYVDPRPSATDMIVTAIVARLADAAQIRAQTLNDKS